MKIDRSLIGKVIKVKIPDRDFKGRTTLDSKTTIIGTCTFAGYNQILGTKQVVVGRIPIYPVTEFDITLV
jgi:hypothetical protein